SRIFFHAPRAHHHLLSFPTRRSSDLTASRENWTAEMGASIRLRLGTIRTTPLFLSLPVSSFLLARFLHAIPAAHAILPYGTTIRSEEHTSELQSRVDLVCRLLLDKKK